MRALFVAIATLGLALASQSLAAAAAGQTVSVKDPANPTHEECKSVMGHKMDGTVVHDHSSMKGTPGVVAKKPLSNAEMEKMHGKCAAKMAAAKG